MANVIITIETSVKSIVILVTEYPRQKNPKICRQFVVEVPYKNIYLTRTSTLIKR